ncbi:tetratricopeptide repeat protein [Persephonella sp.]|uniref:tetratricopeptide repeat protein n=1 Tax=Persephonella sp. TaxID=2060922 RepID=UPI00260D2687|nr:tetratricopeptide repeat protein [Persephonella sp.]
MSKIGKFLSKTPQEENGIEQDLADIHPFSQVKPRKRKKYIALIALGISTLIVYATVAYFLLKENSEKNTGENLHQQEIAKKEIPPEKSVKVETNIKTENKPEALEKPKITFVPKAIDFKINVSTIHKEISLGLKRISVPKLSYRKQKPASKYKRLLQEAKTAELNKNYDEAIRLYKKIWSISKKNPEVLYRIALNYFKTGKFSVAQRYLDQYLKINKDDIQAVILSAKISEKQGDMKKAQAILEEAYFLHPENKDILENLGKLYEKQNELLVAKDIYKTLADLGYIEGKLGLARIYEKLNDKASAMQIYQEIYEDPNTPEDIRQKVETKIISLQ